MNTLKKRIEKEILEALKNNDSSLLSVLRDIKSKITDEEKNNKNQDLDETQSLKVLEKMAKSRKQSIELFEKGNREDLAQKEKYELSVLENYLPKKLTYEEVKEIVANMIQEKGLSSKKEMGVLIKEFNSKYPGMSDGGTISKICSEYLN
jgi:uncharacterized protein YqeY